MKKPIIALLPLYDQALDRLVMMSCYIDRVKKAGGLPIVIPNKLTLDEIKEYNDIVDGYLFTGGDDVSPSLYNEEVMPYCKETNPIRDILEVKVFDIAYNSNKPILGICRGFQMINVCLGGTLYQDLNTQKSDCINHRMQEPFNRIAHDVNLVEGTPLYNIIKKDSIGVNTFHHQAIKDLASNLSVMAKASDGIIEAAYDNTKKYLWGFQWHPEMIEIDSTDIIFNEFIKACKE